MLLVSAGSLITAYLGLELFALSSYALVALNRNRSCPPRPRSSISCWRAGRACCSRRVAVRRDWHPTWPASMARSATPHANLLPSASSSSSASPSSQPLRSTWASDVYHGAPTAVTIFIGSAPKLAAFARPSPFRRRPRRLRRAVVDHVGRAAVARSRSATCSRSQSNPQAHARLFDHLARRLPVARLAGRRRRAMRRRRSMRSATC